MKYYIFSQKNKNSLRQIQDYELEDMKSKNNHQARAGQILGRFSPQTKGLSFDFFIFHFIFEREMVPFDHFSFSN